MKTMKCMAYRTFMLKGDFNGEVCACVHKLFTQGAAAGSEGASGPSRCVWLQRPLLCLLR